jgi:hypothetical protein
MAWMRPGKEGVTVQMRVTTARQFVPNRLLQVASQSRVARRGRRANALHVPSLRIIQGGEVDSLFLDDED